MHTNDCRFSIITTCKGRLHNLARTLPAFLQQSVSEVIVVDYDCPDGTSAFVTKNHPTTRLVSIKHKPRFNTSHARNLGAQIARGEFLIFLDADVLIAKHFVQTIAPLLKSDTFATFGPPAQNSLRGCCIIPRPQFVKIGGYDELIGGYEGEDLDLYARLRLLCAAQTLLKPDIVIEVIEQNLEERVRFREPDLKLQFLRGQIYSMAKEMVITELQTPILDLNVRKQILVEINENLAQLYAGEKDFTLEVNLPDKYIRGFLAEWEFSRSISVKVKRKASQL